MTLNESERKRLLASWTKNAGVQFGLHCVVICSPAAGSTFTSPAQISASATAAAGFITAMRIYVDGVAQTLLNNPQQSASFTINQSLMIAKGTHTLAVVGYQSNGGAVRAVEAINVSGP